MFSVYEYRLDGAKSDWQKGFEIEFGKIRKADK